MLSVKRHFEAARQTCGALPPLVNYLLEEKYFYYVLLGFIQSDCIERRFGCKHNFAAGIFVDLEKAFDTVNHEILCHKLNYYGIRGVANELIRSFLTNRKQYVSVNCFDSSQLDLKCGVPSRLNLRTTTFFFIYI